MRVNTTLGDLVLAIDQEITQQHLQNLQNQQHQGREKSCEYTKTREEMLRLVFRDLFDHAFVKMRTTTTSKTV